MHACTALVPTSLLWAPSCAELRKTLTNLRLPTRPVHLAHQRQIHSTMVLERKEGRRFGTEGGRACVHGTSKNTPGAHEGTFPSFRVRFLGGDARRRARCRWRTPPPPTSRFWETRRSPKRAGNTWRLWMHESYLHRFLFLHAFHLFAMLLFLRTRSTRPWHAHSMRPRERVVGFAFPFEREFLRV